MTVLGLKTYFSPHCRRRGCIKIPFLQLGVKVHTLILNALCDCGSSEMRQCHVSTGSKKDISQRPRSLGDAVKYMSFKKTIRFFVFMSEK